MEQVPNFWLWLYLGLSYLAVFSYASATGRKLSLLAVFFVFLIMPFWPLIAIRMLITGEWKR